MRCERHRGPAEMFGKILCVESVVFMLLVLGGDASLASAEVSQKLARNIMGKSFLGAEEVHKHLGIRFTEEELAKVRSVAFSEETLRRCRDTHILFVGVDHDDGGNPLTIRRLRMMFPAGGQPRFRSYPKPSELRQLYADSETPQLRWYLIARSLRQESRSKPYWQQEQFLKENEYRERAVVYVYMMLLLCRSRGDRLFADDLVWTKDVGSDGAPVAAGYFAGEGLYVSDWWVERDEHFGLAPVLKSEFAP